MQSMRMLRTPIDSPKRNSADAARYMRAIAFTVWGASLFASAAPMRGVLAGELDLSTCVEAPNAQTRPYVLIGVLRLGERWSVLLANGSKRELAGTGDILGGAWRVEAIDADGVSLRRLSLGSCERLVFDDVGVTALARGVDASEAPTPAPNPPTARASAATAMRDAPEHAPNATARALSERGVRAVSRPYERRITSADIPREPWVCEAARRNALIPCRNTWSMSEDERTLCRAIAEQRYDTCLSGALAPTTMLDE